MDPEEGLFGAQPRQLEPEQLAEAPHPRRLQLPHLLELLLEVGGEDRDVITLNQQAYTRLRCEKTLRIIPGASHLFEEPGKLEDVAEIAAEWFVQYLPQTVSS